MPHVEYCQHVDYVELVGGVHYRRCSKCPAWTASVYGEPEPLPTWMVAVIHPKRGDTVEAWLKERRDEYAEDSPPWHCIDMLLDEYRLRADVGKRLDVPFAEEDA